jgi:hypothetical protein
MRFSSRTSRSPRSFPKISTIFSCYLSSKLRGCQLWRKKKGKERGRDAKILNFIRFELYNVNWVHILRCELFFVLNICYLHTRTTRCEEGNIGRSRDACGTQGARDVTLFYNMHIILYIWILESERLIKFISLLKFLGLLYTFGT